MQSNVLAELVAEVGMSWRTKSVLLQLAKPSNPNSSNPLPEACKMFRTNSTTLDQNG